MDHIDMQKIHSKIKIKQHFKRDTLLGWRIVSQGLQQGAFLYLSTKQKSVEFQPLVLPLNQPAIEKQFQSCRVCIKPESSKLVLVQPLKLGKASPRDQLNHFLKVYLAIVKGKTSPTDSVNDSSNLVALHPTSFVFYFWIAYLTSHPTSWFYRVCWSMLVFFCQIYFKKQLNQ